MITNGDTYTVVMIRGANSGELVHEGTDYSEAYDVATRHLTRCQDGEFPGVTEIRAIRTDRYGCAHVSGRWVPTPR